MVEQVAKGLSYLSLNVTHRRATALLSLLSGGITVARNMASAEQSTAVANALRAAVIELVGGK